MASLPSLYKAAVYERFGEIEDILQIKDVPLEPVLPNDVRIKVRSAALNPIDLLVAEKIGDIYSGKTPSVKKPFCLGWDVAGTVVELGSEAVGKFHVGDEVFAMTPRTRFGTIAEFTLVDADCVALKPKTLDFTRAAAMPLVSATSYEGIFQVAKLQKGERILVVGGSTATGIAAIQFAKMVGAYVIATASTKKLEFVQSIGADEVIDYTTTQWSDAIEAHSLDVFYDCSVDPSAWEKEAQLVLTKQGSRFVTLHPGLKGSAPKFGAVYLDVWVNTSQQTLIDIAAMADSGKLKPVVDSVYPLEKAMDAFMRLKTGRVVGKVVIEVQ